MFVSELAGVITRGETSRLNPEAHFKVPSSASVHTVKDRFIWLYFLFILLRHLMGFVEREKLKGSERDGGKSEKDKNPLLYALLLKEISDFPENDGDYLITTVSQSLFCSSNSLSSIQDVSGPQLLTAYEPEPLAKYGTLDVAFEYDSTEQWLAVTVTAATDIPALKQTGNISWQVHLVLLPTKKQRAKTGVQKGPCPVFTETFKFSRVEQEALGDYAVRFRLYSIRRMKKEKVLGEKVFYLTKLNLQGKIALPVTLEPGSELTVRTLYSTLPEILLGLIYNSATGQLSAEVIQGSHFKTAVSDKPVNTYVKLTMLDSKGKEMSKCKTAVCRGQPNPTYKETFVFQVALFQLSEVSLVVSVFCRHSSIRPRERLGWVSLGLNSTGEEQQAHWTEMKEAEGQQVCHWHTLTDT
uniref:C2 domain-containing protein n=1 Tax=Monopterus albus TaxID=43700 RepID=A0A3Q3KQX4_MONAL